MRFGVTLSERGLQAQPDQITTIAQHAEKLGFYAVEMGDHIIIPRKIGSTYPYTADGGAPAWDDWSEQLTTLSFLAGRTSTIHLITSVLVLPYRHPLLAAKMLATMDVLSKGRLIVGVGAGWMREEFDALGAGPFEERGRVADEYIRFFKSVWTEETPRFRGKYFSLTSEVKFLPKPVQKPHPPIWVGGESPSAMRRAAALGDGWYPIGSNPRYPLMTLEQLRQATQRLRRYGAEVERGRPDEVGLSYVAPQFRLEDGGEGGESRPHGLFVGDAAKIASDIRACEEMGFSYISFDLIGLDVEGTLSNMNAFSEKILPRLRVDERPMK